MRSLQDQIGPEVPEPEAALQLKEGLRYFLLLLSAAALADFALVFMIVQRLPPFATRLVMVTAAGAITFGAIWLTLRLLPVRHFLRLVQVSRAAGRPVKVPSRAGARIIAGAAFVIGFGVLFAVMQFQPR